MSTPLTTVPDSFPAGTSLNIRFDLADYPAPTWEASLHIKGAGALDAVGVADGTGHLFEIAASATDDLPPGLYQWAVRVSGPDGEILQPCEGLTNVTPDIAEADAGDLQSWAEKTLALVEAAIAGRIPSGMESYQVLGRAISKIPLADLMKIRDQLRASVKAKGAGKGLGRKVLIGFTGTGFDR
jgi:hypothetical protein